MIGLLPQELIDVSYRLAAGRPREGETWVRFPLAKLKFDRVAQWKSSWPLTNLSRVQIPPLSISIKNIKILGRLHNLLYLLYEANEETGRDELIGIVDDIIIAEAWQDVSEEHHYIETEIDNESFAYLLIN